MSSSRHRRLNEEQEGRPPKPSRPPRRHDEAAAEKPAKPKFDKPFKKDFKKPDFKKKDGFKAKAGKPWTPLEGQADTFPPRPKKNKRKANG